MSFSSVVFPTQPPGLAESGLPETRSLLAEPQDNLEFARRSRGENNRSPDERARNENKVPAHSHDGLKRCPAYKRAWNPINTRLFFSQDDM
jgi:hypothetical protein